MTRILVGCTAALGALALASSLYVRQPVMDTVAADRPELASRVSILQGEVVAVSDDGREIEARISLQWAPEFSALDRRFRFLTGSSTRLVPAGGGVTALAPGDPVQIVALPEAGDVWRALEVTKVDLD